jgi:uncharacterized membrane protein YjgN (DUF898 family)
MTPGTSLRPSFHGSGGTLFGLQLKNLFLTILTLGIYAFWGRADVRRYVFGQTALSGDRFAFVGTGGEMLKGWLKAMGLIVLMLILSQFISSYVNVIVGTLVLYFTMGLLFFPFALVGSRRYRLNRTTWRGVRFGFTGEVDDFMGVYVPGILLTVFTFGIYSPIFHANVRKYLVDQTKFGSRAFNFTGNGKDLFGRFLLAILLTPFTLGLYWFWFNAYRHRYYWSHTNFQGATFRSDVTGESLLALQLTNALLVFFTLGIGASWAQVRSINYQCENITLVGDAGFNAVLQGIGTATATGEELGEVLDVDMVGADFFGL